jgi:hypothetical protein
VLQKVGLPGSVRSIVAIAFFVSIASTICLSSAFGQQAINPSCHKGMGCKNGVPHAGIPLVVSWLSLLSSTVFLSSTCSKHANNKCTQVNRSESS